MSRLLSICSVTLCMMFTLLFGSVANAAEKTAAAQLSTLLQRFDTYQANFSQRTVAENQRVLQTASGVVMIKRPGKFRWELQRPAQQILITDSKIFWFYDVDLAQATQQNLAQRTTIDPVMLLSGSAKDLSASFTVRPLFVGSSDTSFLLFPKKQDVGFKKIILTFQGDKMIEMVVENNLLQTSMFRFSNIRLNLPLADSLFTFKAPAGVDVVTQ